MYQFIAILALCYASAGFSKTLSGRHVQLVGDKMGANGEIIAHRDQHFFELDDKSLIAIDEQDPTTKKLFESVKGRKDISVDAVMEHGKVQFRSIQNRGQIQKNFKDYHHEQRSFSRTQRTNYVLFDASSDGASPDSNEDFLNQFPAIDLEFGNQASTIKIGFVRVHFNDSTPEDMQDYSQDIIDNLFFSHPHSSKNLFHVSSFGQINLTYEPDTNNKPVVFDAYIDMNYQGASCNSVGWQNAAREYLATQNQMLDGYHSIVFYLPRGTDCWWAGLAMISCDQNSTNCSISMRYNSRQLFNHELGHNLGLRHSGAILDHTDPVVSEYSDQSSMMGGGNFMRQFNAPFLDQLGLLDVYPGSVVRVSEPGTYTLRAVNQEYAHGDTSVAKIELLNGKRYFISLKSLTNYDQLHSLLGPSLSAYPYQFHTGANIHTQDSAQSRSVLQNVLEDGEQFVSTDDDIKITQISSIPGESVTVFIEPPQSECLQLDPVINIPATFLSYDAAVNTSNVLPSQLVVTNVNQGECESMQVQLSSHITSLVSEIAGQGLSISLDNLDDQSFELATGESRSISFHVAINDQAPYGYQRLVFDIVAQTGENTYNVSAAQYFHNKEVNCEIFMDAVTITAQEAHLTANIGEGAVYEFNINNQNPQSCASRQYLVEILDPTNNVVNQRVVSVDSGVNELLPIWLTDSLPVLGNSTYNYHVRMTGLNSFSNAPKVEISHTTTSYQHCPGDVDNDRVVGINDLIAILPYYGSFFKDFDEDHNYSTNVADLLDFAANYGNTCE